MVIAKYSVQIMTAIISMETNHVPLEEVVIAEVYLCTINMK